MKRLKGVIFDLDGTLVDSRLDFAAIRRSLGLLPGVPILEAIAAVDDPGERARLEEILLGHEFESARNATWMPGAPELLEEIRQARVPVAIFTRNARAVAELTLRKLDAEVSLLVAREDAPAKPDPRGLLQILDFWRAQAREVVFVGDFLFDLEAGERAGIPVILYQPKERAHWAERSFAVVRSLSEVREILDREYGNPIKG